MNDRELLEKIDNIVESDEVFDFVDGHYPDKPFTQEEAKRMSKLLGQIYSLAHRIHCEACRENVESETL